MKFYDNEIKDLIKAWITVTLVFTIAAKVPLAISLVIVGLSVILHELAHKYVAQSYGMYAKFESNDKMAIVSMILSFLGLIFIAPGAVVMQGTKHVVRLGRVAAAGPATNIVLGFIFLLLSITTKHTIFAYGLYINAILAIFNLIPVPPLDGGKIFWYNRKVYVTMIILSGILLVTSLLQ